MIRIIIVVAIVAAGYFLFTLIMSSFASTLCTNCDGHGYWKGTRGEKNRCKTCDGTGKKP